MIINSLQIDPNRDISNLTTGVLCFPSPLLFTAGLGIRASKPEPASNWPLPTLSLQAPCSRRTGLVARNSLDQEFVLISIAGVSYSFFAL